MDWLILSMHCVKSVQIRSFFWSVFPAFGLNAERYKVSLRIQSECGKIRTRKNPVSGHFSRSDSYSILKNLADLSLVILINYSYGKHLRWRALLTPKRRNPFLQSSPSPMFVGVLDELRHNFYWHWEVVWNYVFMWSFIQS